VKRRGFLALAVGAGAATALGLRATPTSPSRLTSVLGRFPALLTEADFSAFLQRSMKWGRQPKHVWVTPQWVELMKKEAGL
jgi:hypothetical protein